MAGIATRSRLPAQAQDVALAVFVALMQIQGTRQVAPDQELANLTRSECGRTRCCSSSAA